MAEIALIFELHGFSGNLLIRWMENDNPLKVIGQSKPLQFGAQRYHIGELNPVVHVVEFWQSEDGNELSVLLTQMKVFPNNRLHPGKVKINGDILVKALTGDLMTQN